MAEQGLGFHALIARGPGSIPGWESKIPTQLKKLKLKKNLFKKWQIQLSQHPTSFPRFNRCVQFGVYPSKSFLFRDLYFAFFFSFCLLMWDYNIYIVLLLACFFFWSCHWHRESLFPDQRSNSCLLNWKCVVLTTRPPGKSLSLAFLTIECVGFLFK